MLIASAITERISGFRFRFQKSDFWNQIWEASSLLLISSFVVSFSSLQQNLQVFLFWRQIGDAFSFVVVVHFIAEGDVKTEWSCYGCCTLRYNLNCWESSKTSLLDGIYWDLLGSIETDTWGARGRGAPCHFWLLTFHSSRMCSYSSSISQVQK